MQVKPSVYKKGAAADLWYIVELILGHDTKGMAVTDTVYDDADIEQLKSISEKAPHRNVTLTFINVDIEGEWRHLVLNPRSSHDFARQAG